MQVFFIIHSSTRTQAHRCYRRMDIPGCRSAEFIGDLVGRARSAVDAHLQHFRLEVSEDKLCSIGHAFRGTLDDALRVRTRGFSSTRREEDLRTCAGAPATGRPAKSGKKPTTTRMLQRRRTNTRDVSVENTRKPWSLF